MSNEEFAKQIVLSLLKSGQLSVQKVVHDEGHLNRQNREVLEMNVQFIKECASAVRMALEKVPSTDR